MKDIWNKHTAPLQPKNDIGSDVALGQLSEMLSDIIPGLGADTVRNTGMTLSEISVKGRKPRRKKGMQRKPVIVDSSRKSSAKKSRLTVVDTGVVMGKFKQTVLFVQFSVACAEDRADVTAEIGIGFDGGTDSSSVESYVKHVCFVPGHVSDELEHLQSLESIAGSGINVGQSENPDWTLAVVADDSVALDIGLRVRGVKAA